MPKDELPPALVLEGGQHHIPKGKLGNRGQPGIAGFYQVGEAPQVLVKQDKPGTCLAESLAVVYLPPDVPDRAAINRAHVAVGHAVKEPKKPIIVSVQARVAPKAGEVFKKFDELVLGHERDPDAWVSEEEKHKEHIKSYLAKEMTLEAKLQLAQAIYLSEVNGDESLHTGQFVCSAQKTTDAQGKEHFLITDIKRIDFGALGRFAMERAKDPKNNRPDHASHQYQFKKLFNQGGKDYVSYLMEDPFIKAEVFMLWSKTDPQEVAKQVGMRFDEQLLELTDPKLKSEALAEFNHGLGAKGPSDETAVRTNLVQSTEKRCQAMKQAARAELSKVKTTEESDRIAVEAFEQYLAYKVKENPKDVRMKIMQQHLENIRNDPIEERLKECQILAKYPGVNKLPEPISTEERIMKNNLLKQLLQENISSAAQKDSEAEVSDESGSASPGSPGQG